MYVPESVDALTPLSIPQAIKVLRSGEYTPFIVFIAAPTLPVIHEVVCQQPLRANNPPFILDGTSRCGACVCCFGLGHADFVTCLSLSFNLLFFSLTAFGSFVLQHVSITSFWNNLLLLLLFLCLVNLTWTVLWWNAWVCTFILMFSTSSHLSSPWGPFHFTLTIFLMWTNTWKFYSHVLHILTFTISMGSLSFYSNNLPHEQTLGSFTLMFSTFSHSPSPWGPFHFTLTIPLMRTVIQTDTFPRTNEDQKLF